jgi:TrmH family RNA methyltransferase
MGSIFAQPVAAGEVGSTPAPRAALVAHGGGWPGGLENAATLCLGAEREGLPPAVLEHCEERLTIPLRDGAESLNVAAAAAIACERISSRARASTGAGDA